MRRSIAYILAALATVALGAPASRAGAPPDGFIAGVRATTEALASHPSRVVGFEGHDAARDAIEARLRAIPGVRVWRHTFPVVAPQVLEAYVEIAGGPSAGRHRVYPLWPASIRLNTTPAAGIEGRLVYVGGASAAEIPPALRGQIAVMEAGAGNNWQSAVQAGARAVVILGSPDEDNLLGRNQLSYIPLSTPRVYVPDGPLAAALREAGAAGPEARLVSRCAWRTVEATNLYALAPGKPGERAIGLAAPYDAMSIAPELAPGADAAVDAALALEYLERYARSGADAPLAVAFVDAFSYDLRGMREMMLALSTVPEDRRQYVSDDEALAEEYREYEQTAERIEAEADPLAALHATPAAFQRHIKDEVDRVLVGVIEEELYPRRLARFEAEREGRTAESERIAAEIEALDAQRKAYLATQRMLLTGEAIAPERRELAARLWQQARRQIGDQYRQAAARLELHKQRDALRRDLLEALAGDTPEAFDLDKAAPIAFLVGLDLSDAGPAVGLVPYDPYLGINETQSGDAFIRWVNGIRAAGLETVWPGGLQRSLNLATLRSIDEVESYTVGEYANVTGACRSFGQPALTWGTVEALRRRVDTPRDTAEALDWSRLAPQVDATWRMLERLLRGGDFDAGQRLASSWRRLDGVIVDQAQGEPVARLPMSGYATILVNGSSNRRTTKAAGLPHAAGVRRQEVMFTGADGRFYADGLPVQVGTEDSTRQGYLRKFFVQSYRLDADGRIRRAVDMLRLGRGVRLNAQINSRDLQPLRAVVFTCAEMDLVQLLDPRWLKNINQGSILDARSGSNPRRLNVSFERGCLSAQLPPDLRWELVLRASASERSMALLNMEDPASYPHKAADDLIRGWPIGKPLQDHPMLMAARDLYRLDERRIRDYARAGVTSRSIDEIHERTKGLLEEAEGAAGAGDGRGLFNAATGALANEVRAYRAVLDTGDDVVRGAILLLLGLVPFSFAMERLLVGTPRIYRQIAWMMIIFFAMTGVLWSFHPAFRIGNQPLMIVMAFAIIFMSLLVISVVYAKFEAGLEEARTGRAEASGARTSRFGVLSTAVRLGIANMRKRRMRTALTGLTIVLITFALLCFVSSSSYVGKREKVLDEAAPYTGVLVRQPSRRYMPPEALDALSSIVGEGRVVPRYWWVQPKKSKWRIHVRSADGRQVSVEAGLGVVPAEGALSGLARVCPDWGRFAEGNGCYLSATTAEELGARPGDRVVVAGMDLELVGVFDGRDFAEQVRDLDGQSILPINFTSLGEEQLNFLANTEVNVLETESAALDMGEGLPPMAPDAVVILPYERMKGLRDVQLRSMAVAAPSAEEAGTLAASLAGRFGFPVYFGSRPEDAAPESPLADGRARVLVAMPLLPRAPKSLAIPLAIAGLIIFSTMLSSIAERRREIYIYTSLGLAPLHVGALFLAEAATYGLMGSVFGYVVGQGLATVLSKAGLLGNITLNYSGTQAIATMAMVLGVVVLSSLVPAVLAGRLAVPSNRMSWSVPEPDGDRITDTLPFTVTGTTAGGVLAFLAEYVDAHRDGSIGHFQADALALVPDEAGGEPRALEATVWLAPFDLGVRQRVRLSVRPTDEPTVREMDIELVREAGQQRTWRSLNRVFLGDLRRQLLGWRQLKTDRILDYIRRAREFRTAAP